MRNLRAWLAGAAIGAAGAGSLAAACGGDDAAKSASPDDGGGPAMDGGSLVVDARSSSDATISDASILDASAMPDAAADAGAYNYVFVTTGIFAPDAIGGLQGADQICMNEASDAGLPGVYRALLSRAAGDAGAQVDAVTRFAGARGWIRTDGRPAIDRITDVFDPTYRMFYPLRLDAHGAELPFDAPAVLTATDLTGAYDTNGDCDGWTTNVNGGVAWGGATTESGEYFTTDLETNCAMAFWRLYCFQIDHNRAIEPVTPNGARIAFVTRGTYASDEGIPAFDRHCADDAADAGLSGQFASFIATSTTPATARFSVDGGTWSRPDGVILAASAADVFDPNKVPLAAANQLATGGYEPGSRTLTGIRRSDTGLLQSNQYVASPGLSTCGDWTSADAGSVDTGFSTDSIAPFCATTDACKTLHRLACLQQ